MIRWLPADRLYWLTNTAIGQEVVNVNLISKKPPCHKKGKILHLIFYHISSRKVQLSNIVQNICCNWKSIRFIWSD